MQDAAAQQRRSRSDFGELKRAITTLSERIPEGKDKIYVLYSEIEAASDKGEKIWNAAANSGKIDKSGCIAAVKSELFMDFNIALTCMTTKNIRSSLSGKSGKGIEIQRIE